MSTTLNKSASTTSVGDIHDSLSKDGKHKKEKSGLTQRITKLSLFGRKHRGKEAQSATFSREQLQDYLNNQANSPPHDQDDIGSVCEDESALILWEEDGNVKAATPVMLVRRITDEKFVDSNLVTDVIVSYRYFITPTMFLELLIERFEASSPIALRVCAVLKSWIERQWCDFDTALVDSLTSFLKNTVQSRDILKNVADQLLKMVSKKQSPDLIRTTSLSDPPKPLLPLTIEEVDDSLTTFGPTVTLWSFPAKEVARQLTLVEHRLYRAILANEFIAQAWAKDDSETRAPHVLALIQHFNKVSGWVCTEIIGTQDLQQRIERVLQLIDVSQHFFTMNNFNGLMAVLAGLHSSSVHRLKRTWAGVSDKSKETFEYLTQFMSSAKNYSQYREHLQKAQLPVLPYLGVCLSDLTFIEDGNPAEISHLVNFSKCRQIAAVIRKLVEFQSVPYSLVSIPFVQNYFHNIVMISEKQAYDSSTKLEPRAQSTLVSTSAANSFSSLTSSLGLDKDFVDLGESSEIVESEHGAETMHTRFRKDLIRSRNNSLNVGEPFTVKVQLPGSLPVEMRMPPNTTSRLAVKHFADFFSGLNEHYCLVVMPCKEDAKGYVFENEEMVNEVLRTREKNKATTKLALFASPLMATCALFNNSVLGDCKDVLVDLGAPLFSLFSLFQETLSTNEEIALMAYDQPTKQAWWMNTHKSMEANHFEKSCLLVVFPVSNLLHRSVESLAGGDKQGTLLSGGREGTLKVATVRQLLAVLSGPFLLCYKTKHDAAPIDIIVLDRYSVHCGSAKHVSVLLDKNPIFPAATNSSNKSHYSFAADVDSETRAWLRAFQRNRGVLGDKVTFGEDLDRCAKTQIPLVVQKTINFIYANALQMDGLFKPHTNSSLVQHYKNQFDQGVEVEFTRTNDACTVAQLLLMYFEELPNPLLTYELFSKFVEFGQKLPAPDDEATVLRDIVSHLSYPHMSVLSFLLAFLSQVSIENPIKTGINNIFGPCLLRAPPLEGEPKGYKEISRGVLGKLIQHREKIFAGLQRRPEPTSPSEDPKAPPSSNMPNNNNPQCKEFAASFEKQLQNNAAIAKRVELLKSQLENKYMDNKYQKSAHLKRQVSLHEDIQHSKPGRSPGKPSHPHHHPSRSPHHRAAKSVSYVTRPTFSLNGSDELPLHLSNPHGHPSPPPPPPPHHGPHPPLTPFDALTPLDPLTFDAYDPDDPDQVDELALDDELSSLSSLSSPSLSLSSLSPSLSSLPPSPSSLPSSPLSPLDGLQYSSSLP